MGGLLAVSCAGLAHAQTVLNGNALALRSIGSASGSDWVLSENGYVGSYITLAAAAEVTIGVQASGAAGGGASPRMNLVVGDARTGFDVAAGFNSYEHTFTLPAGTHFIRTEYTNDFVSNTIPAASRSMTVRNLSVAGATVDNSNTDALALAAADTYIQTGRRGAAHLSLVGATPGAAVGVQLKQHAFNWGSNFYGTANPPAPLAIPQFREFFLDHFNMVVPSRAGKWNNNESTRDVVTNVTSGYLDAMLDFAEENNLGARMHNLIWGNDTTAEEQPAWVVSLLNSGNAASLADLRGEISERIDYYIGDGPGGLSDLSSRYSEVDIYNESWHTGVNTPGSSSNYWDRYGASGIAGIYDEAAQAIADSGTNAKIYVNEYNVLQNGQDAYGNWYRQHIELHQNADGDPTDGPVQGIGMQLYPVNGMSPAYMQQVLQNMSVLGLPQTISEFGVQASVTDPLVAKEYVNEALRIAFGAPDMTTFMYWGVWAGATSDLQRASVLANADWSLTDIGKMYEDMLGIQDWDGNPANGWTTDLDLVVGPEGTIDFTGFYGDFEITIGGKTYALRLEKGTTDYQLVIALAGDFDEDGTVDADDLARWQEAMQMGTAAGDADGDLDTDGADFLVWQQQLGLSVTPPLPMGAATSAPEPAGMAWALALGTVFVGCVKRTKR